MQNRRDWALEQGEYYAQVLGCTSYPIDPLQAVAQEPSIHAEGADLGTSLDGRLKYLGRSRIGRFRFLLAYNTRYDSQWNRAGTHHPRVRFTIAHELGHYYIDTHRTYLVRGGQPYSCLTEAYPDTLMELEADAFAAGFLMPPTLLSPMINRDCPPEPTLEDISCVAARFQVSLTSMMIRWTGLSDFPCAVFSVEAFSHGIGIRWGWVSEAFVRIHAYWRRYGKLLSQDAKEFLSSGSGFSRWRSGHGLGLLADWVDTTHEISVTEYYSVIPHTEHMLVFITASEDDVMECSNDSGD
jgi:hypothetical protein